MSIRIGLWLCVVAMVSACSSGSNDSNAGARGRQTLLLSGDCDYETCGAVPSSFEDADEVECSASEDSTCGWAPSDDDATVEYRVCTDDECPERPDVECPPGTERGSQQCGSENDGPCTWSTACVPPRVTTPCPDENGCDSQAQTNIGILCKDGSTGGFACVTDGEQCFWERDCD